MWEENATTAKLAAQKFLQLMKTRPNYWAENIQESVQFLEDEQEQMLFLQWCADPTNACDSKNRTLEKAELNNITFENHPDYKVTKITPGKIDTVHVLYTPQPKQWRTVVEYDDEKIQE